MYAPWWGFKSVGDLVLMHFLEREICMPPDGALKVIKVAACCSCCMGILPCGHPGLGVHAPVRRGIVVLVGGKSVRLMKGVVLVMSTE